MLGDNNLRKIHDPKLVCHLLNNVKQKQEHVIVWKFIGDKKIISPIRFDIIKKVKSEISISAKPGELELFQKVVGGSEKINFFCSQSSLLFQCELKQVESEGKITVTFPLFVAQVERRKWIRLKTDAEQSLRLQFCKKTIGPKGGNQFFSKALNDIGASGLSFLITRAETKFFIPGELIKGLELIIAGQKIVVSGQILRVQEISTEGYLAVPYKVWKVSVNFSEISKKDQDLLSLFVFKNIKLDEKAV